MNGETLQTIESVGGFTVAIAVLLFMLYMFVSGRIVAARTVNEQIDRLIAEIENLARRLLERRNG